MIHYTIIQDKLTIYVSDKQQMNSTVATLSQSPVNVLVLWETCWLVISMGSTPQSVINKPLKLTFFALKYKIDADFS